MEANVKQFGGHQSLRTDHQVRVEKFMELAGQHPVEDPWNPPIELLKLRARLILEEALETIAGMGIRPEIRTHEDSENIPFDSRNQFAFGKHPTQEFDLIEVIDGCCDVSVVTTGTMAALGLPMEPFLEAIDENNLEKFTLPGGYRDAGGKWIKPPGHKKPDLKSILDKVFDGRICGGTDSGVRWLKCD